MGYNAEQAESAPSDHAITKQPAYTGFGSIKAIELPAANDQSWRFHQSYIYYSFLPTAPPQSPHITLLTMDSCYEIDARMTRK